MTNCTNDHIYNKKKDIVILQIEHIAVTCGLLNAIRQRTLVLIREEIGK